jgi:hypothetical protein
MAQSSTARTPESVKNELLMAKLLQQSAAANTGPYTSGGVTALKALSGLMGGLQERQAEQANAQGQAQSNATLAAALKAYAANRNGPAPTFGDAAAASAGTSPSLGIPTSAASSRAGNPGPYDPKATEALIRARAPSFGIDPDTAVKVARSEGLNVYHGDGGSSFGPFQLHYGGVAGGGNAVGGLGDTFTKQTGLDARDPSTVPQQVDFALSQASKGGWGPWHGAQRVGLGNFAGIGGARTASADTPAPNARNVSSDTLPPGITPDMVSAPPSPFGAMPTSMAQAPAVVPAPAMLGAPPPTPDANPFGAAPSPMVAPSPSPNSQALAAALRQSVAPPAAPLAGGPGTDAVTAPPLTVQGGNPLLSPTPMDQQGGIGGPAPSPQILASVLKGNAPLQGSSPMMPASAPMPPLGAQSGAQPGNPFGAMPQSMAQAPAQVPTPPAPAPDLSANGLQMAALGGGDPGMAAVLQAGAQAQAAPAAGISSTVMPGMDNFMNGGGSPDGAITSSPNEGVGYSGGYLDPTQTAVNGNLFAAPAPLGVPDPAAPPTAVAAAPTPPAVAPDPAAAAPSPAPSMPIMARASSNPPQMLAQALRASQPATSPADQPAGDPGLPDTGPMPPPGAQTLANADAPAPGANAAGPASVPPGVLAQALRSSQPQPLGIAGDGGGDPSSARAFLTQQAQGAQPSVLAQALRQQNGMPSPAQSSGGGFDLGSLFGGGSGGGNPLSGIPLLGSLFGGGQQQPSLMPTGTPASSVQQSAQPAPQGSGSGPMSFMGGLGGGLFGGQQQAAPAPAVTGQAAIDAALADPRISDSIKMKLMDRPGAQEVKTYTDGRGVVHAYDPTNPTRTMALPGDPEVKAPHYEKVDGVGVVAIPADGGPARVAYQEPQTDKEMFDGKSIEGKGLNYLVKTGQLTQDQAAQFAAGKTITNPVDNSIIFMTPQGLFRQPGPKAPLIDGQQPQAQLVAPIPSAAPTPQPATGTPSGSGSPVNGNPGMLSVTGAKPDKFTNDQTNAAGFANRMADAEKVLSDPKSTAAMTSAVNRGLGAAPLGLGNYAVSPEYQQADQAKRNFVNAVLRKESGAAIGKDEFTNADKQYFPQPGDGPDVIAQKAQSRAQAIQSMQTSAGPAFKPPAPPAAVTNTAAPAVPTGITPDMVRAELARRAAAKGGQ